MGELFANMEHMDIQAERRNTAEQRARAEEAEARVEKERVRGIRNYIDTCREFGLSQEEILGRLVEKFGMSRQEAEDWLKE